jgi:hypothetical protein
VPEQDRIGTNDVPSPDKLDAKLSNKPDPDLAQIVAVWPNLPDHIKAAILALVKTVGGGKSWRGKSGFCLCWLTCSCSAGRSGKRTYEQGTVSL